MNEHLLIFAGLVLLIIIIIIVFCFRKEKFDSSDTGNFLPSDTGNGALVGDKNGNLLYTASLPLYSIIPWVPLQKDGTFNSTISNVTAPNGWIICDGRPIPGTKTNTPDLTQRYLRGASNIGFMGGNPSSQVSLNTGNLPSHTHIANVTAMWGDSGENFVKRVPYAFTTRDGVAFTYGGLNAGAYPSDVSAEKNVYGTKNTVYGTYDNPPHSSVPFNIEPQYFTVYYIMKIA
jgi:hypothetical protein